MTKNSTHVEGFQRVCGWCEQTAWHLEWTFEPLLRTKVDPGVYPALKGTMLYLAWAE